MKYYIYILYSNSANRYYIGYSSNPITRLSQHLKNDTDKYTGKWKDWELKAMYYISNEKSIAIKMERFIKAQKSRSLLVKMINHNFKPTGKLAQLVRVPHMRDKSVPDTREGY